MSCSFRIWQSISKTLGMLLIFSCTFRSTFRREVPFGNSIYLSKYLVPCSSRIYLVRLIYLQNPWSGCLFFHASSGAPSGGRHPLEMKYSYPGSLCNVVLEYIWLKWFISKNPWSVGLFVLYPQDHLQEGGALGEWKIFTLVLCHIVSEYTVYG